MRGEVLTPPPDGGLALALKGDARFTRTASEATKDAKGGNLAAATADVWLVRTGIEGSRRFALRGDAAGMVLTPSFELGVRLDGGDAETGLGVDLGGGLAGQYLQASSSVTQCPGKAPKLVEMDIVDAANGITLANNKVTVGEAGPYLIVAAPQVGREGGGPYGCFDLWLRVNGTDVANSNVQLCQDEGSMASEAERRSRRDGRITGPYPFRHAVEASDQRVRSECRAARFPDTAAIRCLRASGQPRPGRTVTERSPVETV